MIFHVTQQDVGPVLTVDRRTPLWPSEKEPATPRLCACPIVWQCTAARLLNRSEPAFVYRTDARGVKPKAVWDAFLTDERWLLPGHKLHLCQVIGAKLVEACQWRARRHVLAKRKADFRLRLLCMDDACEALGERKPRWLTESIERYCS